MKVLEASLGVDPSTIRLTAGSSAVELRGQFNICGMGV